ncbi:16S rRNA (guanine(527)-N(7))-methyltransferase RsmG [Chitinasiproducens palmae]|uniref:Ribosomal RNA small subunit methyltransferase G n=1 Tax=Chitinasiproducens palmae TaxID=1770053 RepID=A0A1H2PQ88_9BURK|nr:16S rRNA (guanine(527)-N(7))-methyltransferase RsmG [Chitinasiproducens palmae]SDV48517.1 16S rRNA m(7)G-527 methyltransferase [Chitinasiproducens palmae]
MRNTTVDDLRGRIAPLGLDLSIDVLSKLLDYLSLLAKWNAVFNLTAIRDVQQMLVQHLFDCLSILPTLDRLEPARVLDVGSGGGLPGLVIAIARPYWAVTLNDIVSKKTAFLLQVKAALSLDNVEVVNARVETIDATAPFDVITCRAFADLSDFYRLSQHLLAQKGHFVAMKGVARADELARLTEQGLAIEVIPLRVPELDAQRHLIVAHRPHP